GGRWLPLRSRDRARAHVERIQRRCASARGNRWGSAACRADVHRRTLGCRSRWLSARPLSVGAAWGGRSLPRRRTPRLRWARRPPLLAWTRRQRRRLGEAARRVLGHLRPQKPVAIAEHQLCGVARWLHAARSRVLSVEAQPAEWGGQSRRLCR